MQIQKDRQGQAMEDVIKYTWNLRWILILSVISASTVCFCAKEETNSNTKYVFKIKQDDKRSLFRHLTHYNLTKLYEITPSTYIFQYRGTKRQSDLLREISRNKYYKDKIIKVEPVREYDDTLRPEGMEAEESAGTHTSYRLSPPNLVCDNYYGLGVPEAWSRGYSGRGVSITITDVGINTELLDLKDNINTNLSYNFLDESSDVTPEFFYNIQEKASFYTDHGNKVASIVAATKGNNLCSAGIAFKATLTALKIFRVKVSDYHTLKLDPSHWTRSDVIARALVHELNSTDIYANAWAPTKAFDALDLATREAIRHGAEHGRQGLGTIHVVPSSPPGNELSNNVHTITVSSIGKYETVPKNIYIDASVLTSGLGEGNNMSASSMVTTSIQNKGITGFKGVSAATAEIAAIIGLAIEANNNLSLRDIQHLLVLASNRDGLREKKHFRRNAAGRYFHDMFGLGLINAGRLVTLAEKQFPTPRLLSRSLNTYSKRQLKVRTQIFEFCHACNKADTHHCLTTIEHVMVRMNLETTSDDIRIELKSPGGTKSVILAYTSKEKKLIKRRTLRLVSVHFWGELPFGPWILLVNDDQSSSKTYLSEISITLYGTEDKAISQDRHFHGDTCDKGNVTKHDVNTTLTLKSLALSTLKLPESETEKSLLTALWVILSIAFVLLVLCLIKKRYNRSQPTLCPERNDATEIVFDNVLGSDDSEDGSLNSFHLHFDVVESKSNLLN